jgi:phospholipase C
MGAGRITRRQLLGTAALGAGAALLGAGGIGRAVDALSPGAPTRPGTLPPPAESGIDHIVVVMMENRSFDHYLGWLRGADGRQQGLRYPDRKGHLHPTWHLTQFNGCGFVDPDHGYEGGRTELHGGRCDGWLLDPANDLLSIGYYEAADLAFYGKAAPYWTTCDRWFAATMGPTYPNRFYLHAGQTDRQDDSLTIATMPAIWDRLAEAGVSGRYFFSDVPFTALWGVRYLPISGLFPEFLLRAATGTLPSVSYVDPRFVDEGSGTSGDDHPLADIRVGQAFVNLIYEAVSSGPLWDRTLMIVTYDEWGGFFDHVPPSVAPDPNPRNALRGFRVPAILIGPRVRRSYVAHQVFDHTSVLKLIEWRFGLRPLTVRDQTAANIAEVLDFSGPPNLAAPRWDVPADLVALGCLDPSLPPIPGGLLAARPAVSNPTEHELTWARLHELASRSGFEV